MSTREPGSVPPGSDTPTDQEERPFTEEDVATVGFALCLNACAPVCTLLCDVCSDEGKAVLRALAEAGRLLPVGTPEIIEEWAVRYFRRALEPSLFCYRSEEEARTFAAALSGPDPIWLGAELLRRQVRSWPDGSRWIGPWEVVDG